MPHLEDWFMFIYNIKWTSTLNMELYQIASYPIELNHRESFHVKISWIVFIRHVSSYVPTCIGHYLASIPYALRFILGANATDHNTYLHLKNECKHALLFQCWWRWCFVNSFLYLSVKATCRLVWEDCLCCWNQMGLELLSHFTPLNIFILLKKLVNEWIVM